MSLLPDQVTPLIIRFLRVLLKKTIWVLKFLEYSTISMLDSLEDNLTNVGLPEAWMECDSNDVTQIKNNCIKRE